MNWPDKEKRQTYEINEFIKAYKKFSHGRQFTIKESGRERPDFILEDTKTGECFGVELTSVYLSERSVPDAHIKNEASEEILEIPYCEKTIEEYKKRLFQSIVEKVKKARKGYDITYPLILSIYVNEYISIYIHDKECWDSFTKEQGNFWDSIAPFTEVVFWSLPNGGVFSIKAKQQGKG